MRRPTVSTIFPAIPKTVWRAGDAELAWLGGVAREDGRLVDEGAGLVLRGPHIHLDAGLYGVDFQLALAEGRISPQTKVAELQVTAANGEVMLAEKTVRTGDLTQDLRGMYQGIRPDIILDSPIQDVEFRIIGLGSCPFVVRGITLIPRPGQIWFPADLDIASKDWEFGDDRSGKAIAPTLLGGPGVELPPGDYRLGFKLKAPANMQSGPVAALDVIGKAAGSPEERGASAVIEDIVKRQLISAEQLLAHGGIPDAKLRFRLNQPYHSVEFRVKAIAPGLVVQWVRLASADEATWHHYYHLGGEASDLGHPRGAFVPAGPSPSGEQGFQRSFEGGAMYWTLGAGPCEVIGAMQEQYLALGGPKGDLGFPTSRPSPIDETPAATTIGQSFEGGELRWTGNNHKEPVEVVRRER